MGGRMCLLVVAAALGVAAPVLGQNERQVRTFPDFVGTWTLDRSASTGRVMPSTAVRLTIATTSTEVTVTKVLDLPPEPPGLEGRRLATNNPPPEVYRLDGTPTIRERGQYELSYTFLLVADALALTEKTSHWVRRCDPLMSERDAFTMVTDAYSVNGDVLTVHRRGGLNGLQGMHVLRDVDASDVHHRAAFLLTASWADLRVNAYFSNQGASSSDLGFHLASSSFHPSRPVPLASFTSDS